MIQEAIKKPDKDSFCPMGEFVENRSSIKIEMFTEIRRKK